MGRLLWLATMGVLLLQALVLAVPTVPSLVVALLLLVCAWSVRQNSLQKHEPESKPQQLLDEVVYDTYIGMEIYEAKEAWLVTTGSFTRGARYMAEAKGVRLVEGWELRNWLNTLKGKTS